MTFKEFILSRVQVFFVLVTLILFGSAVLGEIYAPEQELRYYHMFSPILLAGACVLPTCVTYFKKEPTPLQYILRQALELAIIEVIVMLLVSPPPSYSGSETVFYITLGIMILIIYVLIEIMTWLQKYRQAKKLTEQLKVLRVKE